ncbi:MAG: murein biosynthesis integral membrane protein MurJ, partial [Syntrophomonadaceae bacterium]|nr:murein biosynthesis integral membrane protein MurJ [Syntrophomonadaceae bacterium]
IPNLVYVVLGGALAAAFLPVFTETLVRQGREAAARTAGTVLAAAALVMGLLALAGMAAAPGLVRVMAPGFGPAARQLTAELTRLIFPVTLLFTLSMLLGAVLNALRHFVAPALTAVAFSLTVIASVYLLVPEMGVRGLALGTSLAALAQMLVQLPALRGRLHLRLRWEPGDPAVRRVAALAFPMMLGTSLSQAYVAIERILASTLSEGSLAALNFANKLTFLPFNLFVMAVNTAVYPTLSAQAAEGDYPALARTTAFGLTLVALFTLPAAVGLAVLAEPLVRLLFEHGAFDARSTSLTAYALGFYVIGLFPQGAFQVLNRAFYSLQDTRTPVKIGVAVVGLNLALSLLLIGPLRHGGLALAGSLAATANMVLAYAFLRRRLPQLPEARLLGSLARILLACAGMGAAVLAASRTLPALLDTAALGGQALLAALCVALGVLVYAGLLLLLRVEEAGEAAARLRRRLARRS